VSLLESVIVVLDAYVAVKSTGLLCVDIVEGDPKLVICASESSKIATLCTSVDHIVVMTLATLSHRSLSLPNNVFDVGVACTSQNFVSMLVVSHAIVSRLPQLSCASDSDCTKAEFLEESNSTSRRVSLSQSFISTAQICISDHCNDMFVAVLAIIYRK